MARQKLTGIVEAVNERGVRINGTWHNYSAYARNGDIDRTAQQGDKVEAEVTSTGWIRSLRILERAAARALDAARYTRLRAVEIAAPIAAQYAADYEDYLNKLSALATWLVCYIEEGDPLG
jgi:hypothetical protein